MGNHKMYRLTEACDDPVQETVTPHIVGFDPADQAVPENIDSHAYAEAIQRKDTVGCQPCDLPPLDLGMAEIYLIGHIHQIIVSDSSAIDKSHQQKRHELDPDMIDTVQVQNRLILLIVSHAGRYGKINTHQQPQYCQQDPSADQIPDIRNDSLEHHIGIVKGISLHRIIGIHCDPDMSHIRMHITILFQILIDLALSHSCVAGKFQTVRIIDQIPSVLRKIIRNIIIGTVLKLRYIRIGSANSICCHHTDHIFQIARIFFIQIITVLILLIVG